MHLDSYGQSFSPNGAILDPLGPIFVFRFFGNPSGAQIAPRRVLVLGPSGALGPWRPKADITEAEGRHFGGVWGGGAPPLQTRGVWGGGSPPTEKGSLELFAIAKSGTLTNPALFHFFFNSQLILEALAPGRQRRVPTWLVSRRL